MSSVPEKDWKLFRKLQASLLAKTCESVFMKVEEIANKRADDEHQSYLSLYDLIKIEDAKIAEMFNNPTRNNVIFKIAALKRFDVLTDDQLQQFSDETQTTIYRMLGE